MTAMFLEILISQTKPYSIMTLVYLVQMVLVTFIGGVHFSPWEMFPGLANFCQDGSGRYYIQYPLRNIMPWNIYVDLSVLELLDVVFEC